MCSDTRPFRFGEIVEGEYFIGRQAELQALKADLRLGQNVVLTSPRRFGKTSLVLRAVDELRQGGALVAYVDLLRAPSKERLASQLAAALYSGLESPFDRALSRVATFFQRLRIRPKPTLNPDGSVSFEFGAGMAEDNREAEDTLEQLLQLPAEVARERRRPVVLVLDEFQEIVELDPKLPRLLRSVFQAQGDVAHLFLGSRQHLLRKVFANRGEPLYRLAKPMTLGPIPPDVFIPFVRERFATSHSQITAEAAAHLVATTQGHPNDTQELGYFAWSFSLGEGRAASVGVVDRAVEAVIDAEAARFIEVWESLTAPQRLVLLAVAREPGVGLYRADTRRRNGLGAPASVQRAVARLRDREVIEAVSTGAYQVPDVFFRRWLVRL